MKKVKVTHGLWFILRRCRYLDYTALSDKFESIWKEAIVAKFKVLSRNNPGGTKETPLHP
jgi:hypothetical protein